MTGHQTPESARWFRIRNRVLSVVSKYVGFRVSTFVAEAANALKPQHENRRRRDAAASVCKSSMHFSNSTVAAAGV